MRPWRARTLCLGLAGLLSTSACKEEPEPQAPTLATSAESTGGEAGAGPFVLPAKAGGSCAYRLTDVLTETLGDQLAAGHEAEVQYTLHTRVTETGTRSYALEVQHVTVKGKREAYSVKLDSSDHGNMVRVRGGADTLLMFDAVLYFALLGQRPVFHVAPNGALLDVEGGDAVRAAYLALHPPKPREDPHQRARVEVALSDDALARRFLPFAALAEPGATLEPAQIPAAKGTFDWAEYPADSMTARRLRWVGDDFVLEEKRAFAPSARPATLPKPSGFPKVALRSAEDQTTVALASDDPCFARAATSFTVRRTWQGMIEDEEVTTEQRREGTWLIQPADEAPPIERPEAPARPASPHPATQPAD